MREVIKTMGMVIKAAPSGEYDKRLLLLTRDRGKITAFARGARRPGNVLMGPSQPFVFGYFLLYEGRDAYNLQGAEIINYFDQLRRDMEGACYASYFLEFADFYARENIEATQMLKLLYQTFRALLKPVISNQLILPVFELKAMVINGEYTERPDSQISDSANYTWEYVILSPIESLYTFMVTDQVLKEFKKCVEQNKKKYIDRPFHSLDILKALTGNS